MLRAKEVFLNRSNQDMNLSAIVRQNESILDLEDNYEETDHLLFDSSHQSFEPDLPLKMPNKVSNKYEEPPSTP